MYFPRKLKLFLWLQYLCPQEKKSVWGGWINKYSNHILLNAAIWFQHQLSFFFLISSLSSVGTIKNPTKTCPCSSLLFDLLWFICMFIFLVIMIGLMYFPFFIPIFTVHFREQLHLISSCWVINPGGVHLQTLRGSWVTFPHASSSTGCVFTTLPGWVPAVQLGTLVVRKMVSGSRAPVCWSKATLTEHRPQVTAALDMDWTPRPPCESATVSSSSCQWWADKPAFQSWERPGLWERWEGCLWAMACRVHLLRCLVKRPQGCCSKPPAVLACQASLGILTDSKETKCKEI